MRPFDNPDVRRYSPKETFDPGELLRHSKFGVGKVLGRRDASKILVLFREGEKLLVTGLS